MERVAIALGVFVIATVAAFLLGTLNGSRKQKLQEAKDKAEAMREHKEIEDEIHGMDDVAVHQRLDRWRLPDSR